MKHVLAYALALSASACVQTQSVTPISTASVAPVAVGCKASDRVCKVQEYVVAACRFYPAAETVRQIFKAESTSLQNVSAVAGRICAAVTSGTYTVGRVRVR